MDLIESFALGKQGLSFLANDGFFTSLDELKLGGNRSTATEIIVHKVARGLHCNHSTALQSIRRRPRGQPYRMVAIHLLFILLAFLIERKVTTTGLYEFFDDVDRVLIWA